MSSQTQRFEVQAEWVHVKYAEKSSFKEVYGFAGNIRLTPHLPGNNLPLMANLFSNSHKFLIIKLTTIG